MVWNQLSMAFDWIDWTNPHRKSFIIWSKKIVSRRTAIDYSTVFFFTLCYCSFIFIDRGALFENTIVFIAMWFLFVYIVGELHRTSVQTTTKFELIIVPCIITTLNSLFCSHDWNIEYVAHCHTHTCIHAQWMAVCCSHCDIQTML